MSDSRPSSIAPRFTTVDAAAMCVGDMVAVWGVIVRVDPHDDAHPFLVHIGGVEDDLAHWISMPEIAMHRPRLKTLAEFESMPIEVRQIVWDDMNKRCGGDKSP